MWVKQFFENTIDYQRTTAKSPPRTAPFEYPKRTPVWFWVPARSTQKKFRSRSWMKTLNIHWSPPLCGEPYSLEGEILYRHFSQYGVSVWDFTCKYFLCVGKKSPLKRTPVGFLELQKKHVLWGLCCISYVCLGRPPEKNNARLPQTMTLFLTAPVCPL